MTAVNEFVNTAKGFLARVSFNHMFTQCLKIIVRNLRTVHKDEMKYSESKGSLRV